MKKILILIDGINFSFRGSFSNSGLTANGKPVHVVYGFLKNYIALLKKLKRDVGLFEHITAVCWDRGHEKRKEISQEALQASIIGKGYKSDRKLKRARMSDEERQESEDMMRQIEEVRELMDKYTNLRQIEIKGNEADDIIATCTKKYYEEYDHIYMVTSDKDYFQLLNDKVTVYDAIKKKYFGLNDFKEKYNITPDQWVDLGAFTGDASDSIEGCYGCGEKTSLKLIQDHKTVDGVLNFVKNKVKEVGSGVLGVGDIDDIYLCEKIRDALKSKEIKKLPFPKVYLNIIEQELRIKVAYSLKRMYTDLPIGNFGAGNEDESNLASIFRDYRFHTLLKDIKYFLDGTDISSFLNNRVRTGTMNETMETFHCDFCSKDFSSVDKLEKCPDCGRNFENKMIQMTFF